MAQNGTSYRASNGRSARAGRPSVGGSGTKPRTSAGSAKGAGVSKRPSSKQSKGAAPKAGAAKRPSGAKGGQGRARSAQSDASRRSAARMGASGAPKRTSNAKRVSPHASGAGAAASQALGNGVRAILSNRVATVIAIVVVALVAFGIVDTAANWNKAFGNVYVAGIDVGGKTPEEIDAALRESLSTEVSHAQVRIYASDDAQRIGSGDMTEEERVAQIEQIAQAEQISVEQATANVQSWTTDALTLKASVPYEELVSQAMAVGREDGGIISRLGLVFVKNDIQPALGYDEAAVDALAAEVDKTIGDARIDATVAVEDGVARPVEGHDGLMVDREWLKGELSKAFVSGQSAPSFVAEVSPAPSRITFEQAQRESDGVNRALQAGAVFSYKGNEWAADGYSIGSWTRVETVQSEGGGYELRARIDEAAAIPSVVQGAGAAVRSENVTVKFAKNNEGNIIVRTFGPGNIPEVTPAIQELNEDLYGADGIAWNGSVSGEPARVEITESDAPAALTLEQAVESGIVTVIGEYTTEFSNYEGTENRNHNIKLVSDILDNGIIDADGGTWHFNDRSGDTNEAAGFWAAGSIVEGEYVDSIGGGICQVATTIFNAVFEAGLPINMRFAHQLYIESYPSGRDASVSYPDLDLWWTNDLSSDVLLDLSYTDTSVTARLYSVYTGYTVEAIVGEWRDGAKYGTKFEEDADLGKDVYYTKTTGVDGSSISVTRIVRDEAGEIISDQTFDSNYDAKDEVIVVGPGTDTSKLARKADDSAGASA